MFGEGVTEEGGSYGEDVPQVQCLVLSGGNRRLALQERVMEVGGGPGYGGLCE